MFVHKPIHAVRARVVKAPTDGSGAPAAPGGRGSDDPVTAATAGAAPAPTAAEAAAAADAAGRCPVLAALNAPPRVSFWPWERFQQFEQPEAFEARLFASGARVVSTPASMGLPAMTFPTEAPLMRAVLQREGDITTTTAIDGFGDLIGPDSLLFMQASFEFLS